jgi:uncharacterized OB-fold protein
MMSGGVYMLGFGLIAMVLVVAVPVALISLLIWVLTQRNNSPVAMPVSVHSGSPYARSCSHCGAALQPGWNHCAQCGAPVN